MILKRKNALNGPGESTIMHKSRKIAITDLNQHLICVLCSGYFIDATTIIECLHSFCRSCIVKYLEKNKYCPICDVQVHKTKPLLNIRADQTLQDIVYKLVPRLFHNEMLRRREFYSCHPEAKQNVAPEQRGEAVLPYILTPDETMCLSLEYHNTNNNSVDATTAEAISQGRRYLRCPAAVSVGHLQKLLRSKYELTNEHLVEILHNQDILNSELTLMDLAYIYLWRRKGPLHLTYRIFESESSKKRIKLEVEDQSIETANTLEDFNGKLVKKENIDETASTLAANESESNKDWKEVQLQISENGIMSITGISEQLGKSTLQVSEKLKSPDVSIQKDVKSSQHPLLVTNENNNAIKEMPLQINNNKTHDTPADKMKNVLTTESPKRDYKIGKHKLEPVPDQKQTHEETQKEAKQMKSNAKCSETSTLDSSKSEVSKTNVNLKSDSSAAAKQSAALSNETKPTHPQPTSVSLNSNSEMTVSARSSYSTQTPPIVLNSETSTSSSTPTSTSTTLTTANNSKMKQVQNLSQNHPLKIHSTGNKTIKTGPTVTITSVASSSSRSINQNSTVFSKPQPPPMLNRLQQQARPGTPIAAPLNNKYDPIGQKNVSKNGEHQTSVYNPVLNVPKLVNLSNTAEKTNAVQNKGGLSMKKPAVGYKTLREPPKSWNPQVSRPNFAPGGETNNCVNEKPPKFFKMRNNMPRYLGNPASGVKPMYPCNKSPTGAEKVANKGSVEVKVEETKHKSSEKLEIKKHSIVTIDPKTLKPISEKAPESSSLTEPPQLPQPEMRINQSSVPIFNRTQKLQTSPKNERKSPQAKLGFLDVQTVPKSPRESSSSNVPSHLNSKSPNSSSTSSKNSPPAKKDKPNLNFTPPNPFIPNLTSPNVNPNQFLFPPFSPYDPRVINAYQSLNFGLLYGQSRLPFSGSASQMPQSLMSTLNLEINKNIRASKNYNLSVSQQLSPHSAYAAPKGSPQGSTQSSSQRKSLEKEAKGSEKTDKSLHSAVEKLTVEAKNKVQQQQASQNQSFNVEKLVSTSTTTQKSTAIITEDAAKQTKTALSLSGASTETTEAKNPASRNEEKTKLSETLATLVTKGKKNKENIKEEVVSKLQSKGTSETLNSSQTSTESSALSTKMPKITTEVDKMPKLESACDDKSSAAIKKELDDATEKKEILPEAAARKESCNKELKNNNVDEVKSIKLEEQKDERGESSHKSEMCCTFLGESHPYFKNNSMPIPLKETYKMFPICC